MKTKIIFFLVSLLTALSNAAADPQIKIGLMSELTGSGAPNGLACKHGYEVALQLLAPNNKVGTYSIVPIYSDHKAEGKTALSEFQKLVETDGVIAIASNRANVGMVLNPLSKSKKIPLMGAMSHPSFISNNPYAFRFAPSPELEGAALAGLCKDRMKTKAAVIVLEDDYPLAIAEVFRREFTKGGAKIVYNETVREGETDFQTIVARLKQAQPDVIFVNAAINELGILIRRLREQGLQQQIVSNYWGTFPSVIQAAGSANVEGLIAVTIDTRAAKFRQAAESLGEVNPPSVMFMCYSGLASVIQALKTSDAIRTSADLYAALLKEKKLELADSSLSIENREVQFPLNFQIVQDGKVSWLDGQP